MRLVAISVCAVVCLLAPSIAVGQGEKPIEARPLAKVETVVDGLSRPAGIAVQPETGVLFVVESGGGRIGRVVDGKLQAVVEGAPTGESEARSQLGVGPLGLAFIDKQTLAVGDGGYGAGKDCVRVFKLPDDAAKALQYEADPASKLGPVTGAEAEPALGYFFGLAAAKHGLYITTDGDSAGPVLKSSIKGTKFEALQRVFSTQSDSLVGSPRGITLNSRGEVVVGLMGTSDQEGDSQLVFFSARNNQPLLVLETGLHDVVGVAYSPKTGLLYAVDYAAVQPEQGGLYRLDADISAPSQKVKATKIASLDRPIALAFDKEGTAYIAVQGKADQANDAASGAVVKVGGL